MSSLRNLYKHLLVIQHNRSIG